MKKLLIAIIMMMFCLVGVGQASAPAKEIIAEATYTAGDNDTPITAKSAALLLAKRKALEESGTFVTSSTTIQNFAVKDDQITSLAAATMEITILDEHKIPSGDTSTYYAKIKATVYPEKLDLALRQLQNGSTPTPLIQKPSTKIYNETANQLLLSAVNSSDLEQVNQAFTLGANPSYSSNGYFTTTPFLWAIYKNSPEIVQSFIDNGINVNSKISEKNGYSDGTQPLDLAVRCKSLNIVEILLNAGANTNINVGNGYTPLFSILSEKDPVSIKIAKLLIEKGANINQSNIKGNTPLMVACENGNIELIKILIEKGAILNKSNNEGKTPLDYAIKSGNNELINFLLPFAK